MLSLTNWQYVIKNLLRSQFTKNEIRTLILNQCLSSSQKLNGSYQVDDNKVFDLVICKDVRCLARMHELNISSVYGILSYYEEISYKNLRATYPKKRSKR